MRDVDIRVFLTELYETGKQNDAQEQERGKKMLNLEPETAQFLNMLIRSSRRVRLLEIGTSKVLRRNCPCSCQNWPRMCCSWPIMYSRIRRRSLHT